MRVYPSPQRDVSLPGESPRRLIFGGSFETRTDGEWDPVVDWCGTKPNDWCLTVEAAGLSLGRPVCFNWRVSATLHQTVADESKGDATKSSHGGGFRPVFRSTIEALSKEAIS
jgi:hypothetical protein